MNKGFTLVEIIFSIALGLVLIAAIYSVVNLGQRSSAGIERKVVAQQDVRAALELMVMEIQMASYNPMLKSDIWKDMANCSNAAATMANKGIQEATANSIAVQMDLNNNQTVGDSNEIVRYVYEDNQIKRGVNCSTPTAFLGDTSVRVVNDSGTPVFQYFNVSSSTAMTTISIPDIRRIQITLVVETAEIDPMTGRKKQMTYSTSVIPRNHAIPY